MNHKQTLRWNVLSHPKVFTLLEFKFPKNLFRILLYLLISTVFLFTYQKIYAQRIYPGIKVAGINLGGNTKEEAEKILEQEIQALTQKNISISFQEQVLTLKLTDLGINFDFSALVEQAFATNLFVALFGKNLPLLVKIDQNKLNQFLAPLREKIQAPQNASLKIENGQVIVLAAKEGFIIDQKSLENELVENLQFGKIPSIVLTLQKAQPTILEEQVQEAKAETERMISKPLILTFERKTYKAEADKIAAFIKFVEKENKLVVEFNEDGINEYIAYLAKRVDIKPIDRKILAGTGLVIDEGRDGQVLNRTRLLEQIKEKLKADNYTEDRQIALLVQEKKRGEKTVFPDDIPMAGRFAGKYIDLDISEQRLYLFEGDNLVGAYSVSTGKWSMPTPLGTFSIKTKVPLAYSSKYGLYMPYWMSFYPGYGIHELPYWPGGYREGSSHLGVRVSHGCVRLGIGPAETAYNWSYIGMPVYIHR